jgi:3-oxoacyl-[acyl-carrier-protein] synthase-1
MESEAIHSVFGENVPASSTKPLTGHCLGAAASIETVLCCHLLNNFNGKLLPHINDNEYNNELKPVKLVKLTDDYKKCDICMSNSFGFGGTNAIIILGKKND